MRVIRGHGSSKVSSRKKDGGKENAVHIPFRHLPFIISLD
jgi:hypothetical protein